MESITITQLITLILAGLPLSLFSFLAYIKFFSSSDPLLAKTSTICTNVIGNLTQGVLAVKTVIFDHYEAILDEKGGYAFVENTETSQDFKLDLKELQKEENLRLIAITTTLCHYAKIHEIESLTSKFLKHCAIDSKQILEEQEVISQIPTNDVKKISSIVSINRKTQDIHAFNKGHALKILERCQRIRVHNHNVELNPHLRKKLKNRIERLNNSGEKVIAFAYKPLPKKRLDHYSEEFTENDLVFLGLIGFGDFLKTEVFPTIEEIKKQGIKTYIISSEKERKALAAGRELGLINFRYFESLSGAELESINQQKLSKMLSNRKKDYLFYELEDKHRDQIIKALQQLGEIIAVADRENNLKTLFSSILQQQQNIKNRPKIFFHALSCKITQFVLVLVSIILGTPMPLSITAILVIELLINGPMEFALRTDNSKQANPTIRYSIIATSLITLSTLGIYFWSLSRFGWFPGEKMPLTEFAQHTTITSTLATIILIQILSAGSKASFLSNPYLILVSISSIIIGFFIAKPDLSGMPAILFVSLVLLALEIIYKKWPRNT